LLPVTKYKEMCCTQKRSFENFKTKNMEARLSLLLSQCYYSIWRRRIMDLRELFSQVGGHSRQKHIKTWSAWDFQWWRSESWSSSLWCHAVL